MRIVLVDDENVTLRGLAYLLEHSFPQHQVAGCFSSGKEALDFLGKQEADAVITDINMPDIDGIKLITLLRRTHSDLPILVLSAYSDFSYVRAALVNGALDYILKPYDEDSIRAVLEKAEQVVRTRRFRLDEQERIARFRRYLYSGQQADLPASDATALNEPLFLGMLHIPPSADEALRMELTRSLRAVLTPDAVELPYSGHQVFLDAAQPLREGIQERLESCVAFSARRTRLRLLFAYDPLCPVRMLPGRCRTLIEMLRFASFNRYGSVISAEDYTRLGLPHRQLSLEDYFYLPRLTQMVIQHDLPQLEQYLGRAWSELCMHYGYFRPEVLKSHVNKLLMDLEQALGQYFDGFRLPPPDGKAESVPAYMEHAADVEQLGERLVRLVCSITIDSPGGQPLPKYLMDAVQYIDAHYSKPITLRDIAQHAYINNWYLSTQFGKYMKLSVKEYLNKVRIHHSLDLLRDADAKIYEVSSAVGFTDPAYFSTVFKRFQKMTPREYQKRTGLAPDEEPGGL